MHEIKLAIVIPYYKLTYFEETLQSLLNQTDKRFNLYIGNDNSPENPIGLIEKYSQLIKRYKNYETNLGGKSLTKQWERCIDDLIEDEEWIMLLCDDDLVDENIVKDFYKKIDHHTNNVIKYATKIVNEDASEILSTFLNHTKENSIDYTVKKIQEKKRSTLSEHIFKKEKYLKYKFKNFDLAFGSDDVAWIEYTECGDFDCINSSFVYYRKSILSISNNNDSALKKRKMKGVVDSYSYILNHYQTDKHTNE